jgi:predicted Zn finger-like uncharacterized protein
MILTCPECATSYFVDDSRVPAAGRAVKCSHCGAKWTALPEATAPAAETVPEAAPAAAAPRGAAPTADEIVVEGPEPEAVVAPPPEPPRRRPSLTPVERRSSGGGVIGWVAAAAVVVGLVAGLLVFRSEVARLVPATRPVYASLGLPANPLGLVIEGVKVDPAFQGGRPVLAVSGRIRNVRAATVTSPSLRVSLLDKDGKPLAAKVAQPIDPRVPAGAVRHFAIAIVDPPIGVHDLKVTFDDSAKPGASVSPRAAEALAVGPTPLDAQPLPAGSPDALPKHD